jgi:hypothetical protein
MPPDWHRRPKLLAMSRRRLGETKRAEYYYDWAVRWVATEKGLSPTAIEELKVFRTEAEELLKEKPCAGHEDLQNKRGTN